MKMILLYCIFRILLWLAGHFYSHNFIVPILCVLRRSDKDSWSNFLLLSAVQLIWQITKHLRNTGGGVTFEQNCFNLTVNRQGYYYFPWSGNIEFSEHCYEKLLPKMRCFRSFSTYNFNDDLAGHISFISRPNSLKHWPTSSESQVNRKFQAVLTWPVTCS